MNSLLARLLLIVSVALMPAVGFQAYTEYEARRVRGILAQDEALQFLRLVSSEQQRIVEGAEQVLDAISSSPAVQENRPEPCRKLLANLLRQSPRYNSAAVITLDGHVVCAPQPLDAILDVSDRTYFRLALQTGGFVIGDYTVGRWSKQRTIHMAQPFRNQDGVVAGVVDVALGVDWLEQQLEHLPLPPGATAWVADRDDTILARVPEGARFVGQPLPAGSRPTPGNTEGRIDVTSIEIDGRHMVVAHSPSGTNPKSLHVGIGLDQDLTFAAVTAQNRTGLLLIFAGTGLALAVTALLGTRLIRRPVKRLLQVADHWRTGDLAARSGFGGDSSEFGRLAAAFDRMAAAHEAREGALRTALESTTDNVMVVDRNWRFTFLNTRATTEIAKGRDLLGMLIWDAFPGLRDNAFGDAYRAAMERGVPMHVDAYTSTFGRHFEAHAYPSRDGLTVFFRDMTEQRRLAAALHQSEESFRATFEQATIGMAQVSLDGTWLRVNDRLCAITGYTRDEMLARTVLDITHPDDVPANRALIRAVLAGTIPGYTMEKRYLRRDGDSIWVSNTVSLLRDPEGKPACFIGIVEDITDRRRAESELERATALLRAIGTCSPDPIYAKDGDGRFLFANPAVLAVLGRTAEEVIGRTDAELHHDPAQAAAVMANDRRIIAAGREEVLEETFDAAGLGTRVFRSAKAPLRTEDGTALGMVAVSSDITPLKQAEAALRRLSDDLEARVRAEIEAREAAQAWASHAERMQALGQLAGGIAHDFNNVLQAIAGAAALIERRPGDEANVRRLARLATEATERGASITRRLLAFGRRGDLRAESLDVPALLGGLREILAHTLGAGIEVQVRVQDALPRLLADKGQLETALVNLATNARDAMPHGGRLVLAAATEKVLPDAGPDRRRLAAGPYVRLTVTDTGVGMDAATLARASEPFFTTKDIGVGTGLGLSMAKGFAEQSGGAVTIESTPGHGTTVTLWLPEAVPGTGDAPPPPEARFGTASSGSASSTNRAHILLVDDEPMVREIIAEHLEDAGYRVLAAANGLEALALLEAGDAVDALVTDLSMPGMDGLAVIRAVHERRPGLPAVLLTGHDGVGATMAVGAAVSAAFSLLRKPVSGAKLIDHLRALLAAHAAGSS